jgi:hypothetical protein
MDATFNTNDVKFHLFTLMVFDAHRTKVLVVGIITSRQTCNDLVEWLNNFENKASKEEPQMETFMFQC